jgi:hypothetical protein
MRSVRDRVVVGLVLVAMVAAVAASIGAGLVCGLVVAVLAVAIWARIVLPKITHGKPKRPR